MSQTEPNQPVIDIEASDINKTVSLGNHDIEILKNLSLLIPSGRSVSISGSSGSGKTTLLAILAGLDLPSTGTIRLLDQNLMGMDEDARAALRNGKVGFVFQSFHLLPNLTARENISLALEVIPGTTDIVERSEAALDQVGLSQRADHLPSQLSGGEQQRVALARAMVARPQILFADEPTGNLDHATGESISELMFNLCRETHSTLVLVTHDPELANQCDMRYHLEAGQIH